MSEPTTEQGDRDMAVVKAAVQGLGEHFDTVQIFVTRYEPQDEGGTTNINYGAGNWFARFGQVRDWTVKREEDARIDRRNDDSRA